MKLKQVAFLFLFLAIFYNNAFANIEKYEDVVLSTSGSIVSKAVITVYVSGTATLATIYSGTSGSIIANPITADVSGRYSFYANEGYYDFVFGKSGYSSYTKTKIRISGSFSVGIDVKTFGAVGDGVTDDSAAIQRALDAAKVIASREKEISVFGNNLYYAIGSSLSFSTHNGVRLRDINLVTIGTWTATTPAIDMVSASGTVFRNSLENVSLDCSFKSAGVKIKNESNVTLTHVFIKHFKTFGIRSETKATELIVDKAEVKEWLWGEAGEVDPSQRTAIGYDLQTPDVMLTNSIGAYSLVQLSQGTADVTDGAIIRGNHFYGGSQGTPTDDIGIELKGRFTIFANNHVDNCTLKAYSPGGKTITGNLFSITPVGGNNYGLAFTTSTASDTLAGFIVANNLFIGTYPINQVGYLVSGGGSYSTAKGWEWANNISNNDTIVGPTSRLGTDNVIFGDGTARQLVDINGAVATNRQLRLRTNNSTRWTVGADNFAESGANAGSNFNLNRWDDAGAFVDTPISINRASGVVSINGVASITTTTWSGLPSVGSVVAYKQRYFVTDVGVNGSEWYSDGSKWRVVGGRVVLLSSTLTSTLTGTTGEVIKAQVTIPAGLVKDGDAIVTESRVIKTGTTDTATVKVHLGAAGTIADTTITMAAHPATANTNAAFLSKHIRSAATAIVPLTFGGTGAGYQTPHGPGTSSGAAITVDTLDSATKLSISIQLSGTPSDSLQLSAARVILEM